MTGKSPKNGWWKWSTPKDLDPPYVFKPHHGRFSFLAQPSGSACDESIFPKESIAQPLGFALETWLVEVLWMGNGSVSLLVWVGSRYGLVFLHSRNVIKGHTSSLKSEIGQSCDSIHSPFPPKFFKPCPKQVRNQPMAAASSAPNSLETATLKSSMTHAYLTSKFQAFWPGAVGSFQKLIPGKAWTDVERWHDDARQIFRFHSHMWYLWSVASLSTPPAGWVCQERQDQLHLGTEGVPQRRCAARGWDGRDGRLELQGVGGEKWYAQKHECLDMPWRRMVWPSWHILTYLDFEVVLDVLDLGTETSCQGLLQAPWPCQKTDCQVLDSKRAVQKKKQPNILGTEKRDWLLGSVWQDALVLQGFQKVGKSSKACMMLLLAVLQISKQWMPSYSSFWFSLFKR